MVPITNQTGERSWMPKASTNAPAAVSALPPTVRACQPNRSDSRPLRGPRMTMHTAAGIIISPTCSGA